MQNMPAIPLPPTAQVVADVIGRELTLRLARSVKFRSLYVPKRLPRVHWLRDVIGDDAAETLAEKFQGMQLPLARCANAARAARDSRILALADEGQSAAAIGRRLGTPARTVRNVLGRYRSGAAA